jgi:transcription initiation factor IIE alpha subunit
MVKCEKCGSSVDKPENLRVIEARAPKLEKYEGFFS